MHQTLHVDHHLTWLLCGESGELTLNFPQLLHSPRVTFDSSDHEMAHSVNGVPDWPLPKNYLRGLMFRSDQIYENDR